MSDEPTGDGGQQESVSPPEPRTSNDTTLEMQAVSEDVPAPDQTTAASPDDGEEVVGDDPAIDTAMLAAFLGMDAEPKPDSPAADDVLTGAPVEEDVAVAADVLTGAPVDEVVLAEEAVVTGPAIDVTEQADVVEQVDVVEESATEPAEVDASAAGTPAGPVSHAAPRRSVWPTVLTVLGIIVALVAVGAGGVYVGRMTAETPTVVIPADSAATGEQVGVPSPSMAVGPLPVPAPGTFLVTTARVPTSTWPVVLNEAGPLSNDAGTAPGYRLVNAGISGAQVASILASTFGATGSVVTTDSGWSVGETGEPSVTVTSDPLFSWVYEDPATVSLPASGEPYEAAEAISAATEALAGIGVDISTIEYQVDVTDGRTGVSAWQLVGEQRTQLGWRLLFDADGSIVAASGFSSGLQGVPDYPIVGASEAVARSQQSPWTALPASPIAPAPGAATEEVAPPQSSTGAPTVDLPMSTVDVVGAELGLAQYWQPDGSILLLPSYILTGADGSTWSLLAVADSGVTFTELPFPASTDASGFVAGPFPADDPDVGVDDGLDVGDVTDPAVAEDAGVADGDGNVEFAPSEDPAATE